MYKKVETPACNFEKLSENMSRFPQTHVITDRTQLDELIIDPNDAIGQCERMLARRHQHPVTTRDFILPAEAINELACCNLAKKVSKDIIESVQKQHGRKIIVKFYKNGTVQNADREKSTIFNFQIPTRIDVEDPFHRLHKDVFKQYDRSMAEARYLGDTSLDDAIMFATANLKTNTFYALFVNPHELERYH